VDKAPCRVKQRRRYDTEVLNADGNRLTIIRSGRSSSARRNEPFTSSKGTNATIFQAILFSHQSHRTATSI
jgi:hypothetical protein